MSAIDEKIKKLKEQERQLELEKLKIEFLNHILDSVKTYKEKAYAAVKADVEASLEQFVKKSIEAIEQGTTVSAILATVVNKQPVETANKQAQVEVKQQEQKKSKIESEASPADKLTFALENRHLAGKKVSVANEQNMSITGNVVGLDAPHVIVKTETGPTIKVPLNKVSLA